MNKISTVLISVLLLLAPLAGQSITVVSPNGGETLTLGNPGQIAWTTTGVSQDVKIVLLRSDNTVFGKIVENLAPASSPYAWTVGATVMGEAPAGSYKIRVITMDGVTKDVSDAPFAIAAGGAPPADAIRVVSPNGGETKPLGSTCAIHWESTLNTGAVDIVLLNGGAAVGTIASGLNPQALVHLWHVGDLASGRATERGGYRVRIQRSSGTPHDDSDGDFAIGAAQPDATQQTHDFVVSDPVFEDRGGGKKGFRVTVTDLGSDYNGRLILQQYCMNMGLGNAIKQGEVLDLRRGVPATVDLFSVLPGDFGGDCGTTFRFDVNPDHAVAESNYGNNVIQEKFFWNSGHDGRFFSLRVGRNYAQTCEECPVVIRPADVESIDGQTVRVRLEITVQNCGAAAVRHATVRTNYSWYFRDASNRIQQGETNVDLVENVDVDPGQYRILNRTVTLRRYAGSALSVYFGSGESGALAANNHFHCHPNFIGF
jgi:hypothetical protein